MNERDFQRNLIKKLESAFSGCVILKNDPCYKQGIPDLIIIYGPAWAALECKKSERASHQPNQGYYVDLLNNYGFARFIYPENESEVLADLKDYFTRWGEYFG